MKSRSSKSRMKSRNKLGGSLWSVSPVCALCLVGAALSLFSSGCANFRILGKNLKFMEESSILSVRIEGVEGSRDLRSIVLEWDEKSGEVLSADYAPMNTMGFAGFFVRTAENQYALAYRDANHNDAYDVGEAAWMHSDAAGNPVPVVFDPATRRARLTGRLSPSCIIPEKMLIGARQFMGTRTKEDAISGLNVPVALGDIADLDDPRFSAARGEEGLWKPAEFPMTSGVGVYFLEKYDPTRIPVLFVYGAAGSPQDWRTFFAKMDRKKYQFWFFYYPTGRRLDEMGGGLNRAIEILHDYYGFEHLHVVAHSMGGMVARSFVVKNVLDDGNHYIRKFVTISTPWGGHAAAAAGVKHAPEVVPSWRDMVADSEFQKHLYARNLAGKVDHLLIYGDKCKKSPFLPPENDGTVSVASQTYNPVSKMVVRLKGFHADHVGILSRPDVIEMVEDFLEGKN